MLNRMVLSVWLCLHLIKENNCSYVVHLDPIRHWSSLGAANTSSPLEHRHFMQWKTTVNTAQNPGLIQPKLVASVAVQCHPSSLVWQSSCLCHLQVPLFIVLMSDLLPSKHKLPNSRYMNIVANNTMNIWLTNNVIMWILQTDGTNLQ